MEFSLGAAFGIAFALAGCLSLMGLYNRQSGWRPKRSEDIADILIAWAEIRADDREEFVIDGAKPAVREPELQLLALHAALHSGTNPVIVTDRADQVSETYSKMEETTLKS